MRKSKGGSSLLRKSLLALVGFLCCASMKADEASLLPTDSTKPIVVQGIASSSPSSSPSRSSSPAGSIAIVSENNASIPLAPPSSRARSTRSSVSTVRSAGWIATRVGVVLSLFVGLLIVQRIWFPKSFVPTAEGVVQVYGKVALDKKQQLHFVRVGGRLLVLLQGPQGLQHVTEIDDPEEVQRVLTHWRPKSPQGRRTGVERTGSDSHADFATAVNGIGRPFPDADLSRRGFSISDISPRRHENTYTA